MIAVDTNVLVRLLTGDDPAQAARAAALFAQEHVFIPKSVLLETAWVLRYSYELDAGTILSAFRKLLGLPHVSAEDRGTLIDALAWYENGMNFADALHLASARAVDRFATFDVRLKRNAPDPDRVMLLK